MNVGLGVSVGTACPPPLTGLAGVASGCPFPELELEELTGLLTDVIVSVTVVELVPPTAVVVTVVSLTCVVVELLLLLEVLADLTVEGAFVEGALELLWLLARPLRRCTDRSRLISTSR